MPGLVIEAARELDHGVGIREGDFMIASAGNDLLVVRIVPLDEFGLENEIVSDLKRDGGRISQGNFGDRHVRIEQIDELADLAWKDDWNGRAADVEFHEPATVASDEGCRLDQAPVERVAGLVIALETEAGGDRLKCRRWQDGHGAGLKIR